MQAINSIRTEYAENKRVQNAFEFYQNTYILISGPKTLSEVLNTSFFCRENLYSSTLGGGVATSPMLIVFHGKYSAINPMWHIRHLGKFSFPPFAV